MKRFLRRLFTRLFRIGYDVPFRGRMLRFDVPVDDYFEVGDLMVVSLNWTYMDYCKPYLYAWQNDPRVGQNIIAYDEQGQEVWRIPRGRGEEPIGTYRFFKLLNSTEDCKAFPPYSNLYFNKKTGKLTVTNYGFEFTLDPATGEIIASEWLDKYG